MSEIDYSDNRRCINCIHATYKEKTKDGIELFFCGPHRTFITNLTWVQSTCHGKDYEDRVIEKPKAKPKKKAEHQITLDEWLKENK